MIARIRRGNDFHVAWRIKRGGVAENLENVTNIKLERTIYGVTTEHTLFTVSGDTITAEIPAEVQTHNGQYKLTLNYELVDTGMSDDDRKCKVAIYAFAIVDPLGPADDLLTVDVASDVSIGFKGDKGLSAYQVWLENGNVGTEDDYFAYLRQPATDAAASVLALEQTVSDNEALRVTAEQDRVDAELLRVGAESARSDAEDIRNENEIDRIAAEGIRDANETDRINAESDRVDAEDLRDQAEAAREEAEGLRQTNTTTAIQDAGEATTAANNAAGLANSAATTASTAAGDANDAATAANTAAGLADTARTELTTAVNTKLDEADDKIEEMNTTLSTYDGRVTQVESDIDQLAGDVVLKEATANKQNSLATDGTGTKFPTVDAVNAELNVRAERLVADYTHTSNREVIATSVDLATGTFTKIAHGLTNGWFIVAQPNQSSFDKAGLHYYPTGLLGRFYYVVNATADTFQISTTNGGAAVTFTANVNADLTKWHFERVAGLGYLDFTNIPETYKARVEIVGGGGVYRLYPTVTPPSTGASYFGVGDLAVGQQGTGFSETSLYLNVGVEIDFSRNYYFKYSSFIVEVLNTTQNKGTLLERRWVDPTKSPVKFTTVRLAPVYILNGTNIKIYV